MILCFSSSALAQPSADIYKMKKHVKKNISEFYLSPVQNVPPDLAICAFILEQSLSVRALQEMLANTMEMEVRS